jgi:hypothetical protein
VRSKLDLFASEADTQCCTTLGALGPRRIPYWIMCAKTIPRETTAQCGGKPSSKNRMKAFVYARCHFHLVLIIDPITERSLYVPAESYGCRYASQEKLKRARGGDYRLGWSRVRQTVAERSLCWIFSKPQVSNK